MEYMKKRGMTKNVIFAVILLLLAVYMILSGLGLFTVNIYNVFMTILFVAIAIRGIFDLGFGELLFAIAHLVILYREYLHIPEKLGSWSIVLAGTLAGIALDLLFKEVRGNIKGKSSGIPFLASVEHYGDEEVSEEVDTYVNLSNIENCFGEKTKYISASAGGNFRFSNAFGELIIYLSETPSKETVIKSKNNFGQTTIYIPKNWDIYLIDNSIFGVVDIQGDPELNETSPKVKINASNSFGEILICYI